jgi:hypothetical protein
MFVGFQNFKGQSDALTYYFLPCDSQIPLHLHLPPDSIAPNPSAMALMLDKASTLQSAIRDKEG